MIASIAVPALVALIFKLILLGYALRSPMKNTTTRLFFALLGLLALYNCAEVLLLDHIATHGVEPRAWPLGYIYFALFIPSITLILHISLRLSFDLPAGDERVRWQPLLYLPGTGLVYLLLFTDKLVAGFQPFKNTALRIPGSWYYLFETYLVVYFLAALFILSYGARSSRASAVRRTRNQWWLIGIAPTLLLAVYLIVANHFGVAKVTSTIYVPIALTFFLVVTTYATHQHRLFDLEFYVPWSKTRTHKTALYRRIQETVVEILKLPSIDKSAATLISRTLRCPVTIVLDETPPRTIEAGDGVTEETARFSLETLRRIDRFLVAVEIEEVMPELYEAMRQSRIAAIVPLLSRTNIRGWVLLGQSFSEEIHSPRDFQQIDPLFRSLAQRMHGIEERLDKIIGKFETIEHVHRDESSLTSKKEAVSGPAGAKQEAFSVPVLGLLSGKSLDDQLGEEEKRLICEALRHTSGNLSSAARMLGLRVNTLHYRMKRYGILPEALGHKRTRDT